MHSFYQKTQMIAFSLFSLVFCASDPEPWGPLPTKDQARYHHEELSAFIHWGMNTFTGVEWGSGNEDPNLFRPTKMDTDQWISTLKEAGFKRVLMIGRHHDGFCLWKTKYSDHQVNESKDFQTISAILHQSGDVIEEISKSCTKYDMDMGFYLSPWDVNSSYYGDEVLYNEYYMNQLTEILGDKKYGNNGRFVEVWMDGAKGTGQKDQKYWFTQWFDLIESLQPGCVIFSPYGSTVRWVGNENGKAGSPCWSRLNQSRQRYMYDQGISEDTSYLNQGDPIGDIWSVAECDVSLTSGWFWKAGKVPKSMAQLADIYFNSVGHGQPFLLNVPPNTDGVIPDDFVNILRTFKSAVDQSFSTNFAAQPGVKITSSSYRGSDPKFQPENVVDQKNSTYWALDDDQLTGWIQIDFGQQRQFDAVTVSEHIELGQRISKFIVEYNVDGTSAWQTFEEATTIGAKRICRQFPVKAKQVRVTVLESQATPVIESIGVFKLRGEFALGDGIPVGLDETLTSEMETTKTWTTESEGIWTKEVGATATATVTGSRVYIVGIVDPGHGDMNVYIDDQKVGTANTNRPSRATRQLLFQTSDLSNGQHTVKVECASKAIAIHGFYTVNNNEKGIFELESDTYSVEKGRNVTLRVKRVAGTKGKSSIIFQTSPGSAVHGRHYVDLTANLTFNEGDTYKDVTVQTINNTEGAGQVSFYGEILDATDGALTGFNHTSTITIFDKMSSNSDNQINLVVNQNMQQYPENDEKARQNISKQLSNASKIVIGCCIGVMVLAVVSIFFVIKARKQPLLNENDSKYTS